MITLGRVAYQTTLRFNEYLLWAKYGPKINFRERWNYYSKW